MYSRKIPAFFILIFMLTCSPAYATAMIKFDLSDLTLRADLIVRAEALSSSEAFDKETGRMHEYFALKVKETIKGEATQSITVRQVARIKNAKFATIIAGQPEIDNGHEYLLFLRKKKNLYFILGMAQGHYSLIVEGNKLLAVQKMQGVSLQESGKPAQTTEAVNSVLEYSLLKQRIIDILKTSESGPQ